MHDILFEKPKNFENIVPINVTSPLSFFGPIYSFLFFLFFFCISIFIHDWGLAAFFLLFLSLSVFFICYCLDIRENSLIMEIGEQGIWFSKSQFFIPWGRIQKIHSLTILTTSPFSGRIKLTDFYLQTVFSKKELWQIRRKFIWRLLNPKKSLLPNGEDWLVEVLIPYTRGKGETGLSVNKQELVDIVNSYIART